VPEAPWRDASVTATCAVCDSPLAEGRARSWCSPRCRQAAYRARHRLPARPWQHHPAPELAQSAKSAISKSGRFIRAWVCADAERARGAHDAF